jgi:hypothetical protein
VNQTAIFWPMLAHVLLVYGIYVLMFLRRKAAVQSGSARISQFRENRDEPAESLFVRNNLANQFELPVLFHVACICLLIAGAAGTLALVLAWVFVVTRYVHTAIHVTSNRIRYRQPAFSSGFLALGLMWLLLALRLLGIA